MIVAELGYIITKYYTRHSRRIVLKNYNKPLVEADNG